MAKLVIKFDNDVVDHVELRQGDMRVGRKPGCDIHLDNLAVSGEHANIFTVGDDSFIQDLNSTNGTFINNKRITKHHLHAGDTVMIGKFALIYLAEGAVPEKSSNDDFAKTIIINPGAREPAPAPMAAAAPEPSVARAEAQAAALFVLSGANSGKRIDVTKSVTNLGRTGKRSGTITRTPDGYLLAAVSEGEDPPKLNGRAVSSEGTRLKNGDIIEVAGTRLQFYLR